MSLRPPSQFSRSGYQEAQFDLLGHEILAEKASALGRAGEKAGAALSRWKAGEKATESAADRAERLKAATDAVYAYFIQRELCGFRRHDGIIRELEIPPEILRRLGAC